MDSNGKVAYLIKAKKKIKTGFTRKLEKVANALVFRRMYWKRKIVGRGSIKILNISYTLRPISFSWCT